jgi:hypothetical protein
MRKAIRDALVAPGAVPSVGGRVFEPGQAREDTPRPYLVIEEGAQDGGTTWGTHAETVTVFIEGPQSGSGGKTALRIVDQIEREVKAALDNRVLTDEDTSEKIQIVYGGNAGPDTVPPPLPGEFPPAIRTMVFTAFTLKWRAQTTLTPDPIPGLLSVADDFPPATLQTDPNAWNPADASPGLYWRTAQFTELQRMNWGVWATVMFRGHVVANTDEARQVWTRKIAEHLANQGRVRISDNSPMLLLQVGADFDADPFREGQLAVVGRYGILRSQLPLPPIAPPPINEGTLETHGTTMTVSFP